MISWNFLGATPDFEFCDWNFSNTTAADYHWLVEQMHRGGHNIYIADASGCVISNSPTPDVAVAIAASKPCSIWVAAMATAACWNISMAAPGMDLQGCDLHQRRLAAYAKLRH